MTEQVFSPAPQDFLWRELQRRIDKNPRYTMRAFAKSLGLNVGTLSSILQSRRRLTKKTAQRLFDKLGLGPEHRIAVIEAIEANQAPIVRKESPYLKGRTELSTEVFRAIAEWYHYGILQLVRTEDYKSNPKHASSRWMARQLGITEAEAGLALDRLLKLGLLTRNDDGALARTQVRLTTANKSVTSAALKTLQKQIREKAIHSIENDPIESRCMTSMTMAIDPSKIDQARVLIDEFQEKLAQFLERDKKECVYQLSVSLFPLQERSRPYAKD